MSNFRSRIDPKPPLNRKSRENLERKLGPACWRGRGSGQKGLASQRNVFTLQQIKAATNNCDESLKIGEKENLGVLLDGTIVAIKRLSSESKQGTREFTNEIGIMLSLQHPNIVKLHGLCEEDDQMLLIYEYMENSNLAHALFAENEDQENCQLGLDWKTRKRICIGIIIHTDIKAANVLLDKYLNPKISDFGFARVTEEGKIHITGSITGTYGYMAPEYDMHGYLTDKADVYSFGIVILEIVSGARSTQEEPFSLVDWVHLLKEEDSLMELVDPRLGKDFKKEEVILMIDVALLCTNSSPSLRPSMSSVVSMLEGREKSTK
ncbi:receptor-like kinase [Medicago truncatula]|uniref:Receptor-like kinase n=1 Tax=Medicago truncatula TaxID=3880 RepID=G7LB28_MEDTR|nr:receptor-like kinase [Medicago truncatula]